MKASNRTARYDGLTQVLHWTTALLVLVLLVMGKMGFVDVDHPGSAGFMWHGFPWVCSCSRWLPPGSYGAW